MQSHLSSPWNNAVSVLKMRYGNALLSTGSCFLWSHSDKCFLVTNWHNLAGRNPLTDIPMSPMASLPDNVIFHAFKPASAPDADGIYEVASTEIEVSLFDDAAKLPRWREHPTFGRFVDVGTIEVTNLLRGYDVAAVNLIRSKVTHF